MLIHTKSNAFLAHLALAQAQNALMRATQTVVAVVVLVI